MRKKLSNKIKSFIANKKADKAINQLINNNQIIIKDVIGAHHLKEMKGAAFITSNHFHPFENLALYKIIQSYSPTKHKFWRIIREGNYTASPEGFGQFFRHCNTLPLSSNHHTMKKFMEALKIITKKKSYILVYPEQSMWYNYKKPRPFKDGTFKLAAKYNIPIIPCFITMEDTDNYDQDGLPIQAYTIHIMQPIYPNTTLTTSQNVQKMKKMNFAMCKHIYETTYNTPLIYHTKEKN